MCKSIHFDDCDQKRAGPGRSQENLGVAKGAISRWYTAFLSIHYTGVESDTLGKCPEKFDYV